MPRSAERHGVGRRTIAALLLLGLLGAAAPSRRAVADDVEAFLRRNDLLGLLAARLEERLAAESGEERSATALRLAGVYAELLERERDPDARRALETAAEALAASFDEGAAPELRIALLRTRYRAAEAVAERHRVAAAEDAEVADAARTMRDLAARLRRAAATFDGRAEAIADRLARSAGIDAIEAEDELNRARDAASQARFLGAWTSYYLAFLADDRNAAVDAEGLFAQLLELPERGARPEDAPLDNRELEPIARCLLGIALCRAALGESATAIAWLELLAHPRAAPSVRELLPEWTVAALVDAREYDEALRRLERAEAEGVPVTVTMLRIGAAGGLRAGDRDGAAADLGRFCVATLAQEGELAQVLELAERFGIDRLGTSGFARHYVEGVMRYRAARPDDGGPPDREALGAAAAALDRAIASRDADRFGDAFVDARRLLAWSRYGLGELVAARDLFLALADDAPPGVAAEALWAAVVCVDDLARSSVAGPALARQRDELSRRFVERFPSDPRAARLLVRLGGEEDPTEALADRLLGVPPASPEAELAQSRAAEILFRLYRAAQGSERARLGGRYLDAALPLQVRDQADADDPASPAAERALARGRAILEVALQEDVDRLGAARTVLDFLDALRARDPSRTAEFADEIAYRRVRERLASGDWDGAAAQAEALGTASPGGEWSRLADHAVLRAADVAWREAEASGAPTARFRGLVARFGARFLATDADASGDLRRIATVARVADAEASLFLDSGEREAGVRARERYEALLDQRPNDAPFLRAVAVLASRLGDPERAAQCWRRIVAGLPAGDERWYEARVGQIEALAAIDPARARAVLDQHKALEPDLGPPPWNERLAALDRALPPAEEARP